MRQPKQRSSGGWMWCPFHAEVCVSPRSGHRSLQFPALPPALPDRAVLPLSVLAPPFPRLPSSPAAAAGTVAVTAVPSPAGRFCVCGDTPLGQHSSCWSCACCPREVDTSRASAVRSSRASSNLETSVVCLGECAQALSVESEEHWFPVK